MLGMFLPMLLSFPGMHLSHMQAGVLLILFAFLTLVPLIDAFIEEVRYPGAEMARILLWGGF
ncbi:hypothetical protein [Ralstonia sp.]|uniref:hypothetical protein n=1 Tax=Ralstonia sp. TaxID=54061 RepID=UPI002C053024|nr:hypothetical protein [Ralstonia sp.]HWV03910.1 hypothetical protein [Ralstonia sp.]